ncbi:ornithine cyclodeaminase family protein [Motiliproteus sp. SC1-56]|uniref:ornithine cyclodeaminase family protein n=1 Tax=Motiliproteus sp. SC1-56 TaxID=2799565 RepID=UPI001A8DAAB4|nr:ornithine cyclodeaminase family protein [Motiliproteus sp. SC1-56]
MQLNAEQLRAALPWDELIASLKEMFARGAVQSPLRHQHTLAVPGEPDATVLLMPAWLEGEYLGVKQVNVFPGNSRRYSPGLSSYYTLSCGKTGAPLAQMDGNELTSRRTAAASALASRFLSREDASELLIVGAGSMARQLIPAHLSVRPIQTVRVWNRRKESSVALVEELRAAGIDAHCCEQDQLQTAAQQADIISCATLATEPLIQGDWLKPGAHLDLVGSFTPAMRETDNTAMARGAVFVDTRLGALSESGDLIIPIQEGALRAEEVVAELAELCAGRHKGRAALQDPGNAITVFKSVGDSGEDLAAAILAHQRSRQP